MKSTVRTQNNQYRTSALPGLNGNRGQRHVSAEEVQALKLKIQKMEQEKLQLKSRVVRMKQILNERNATIEKVFKDTTSENQKIQTASKSQIDRLQDTVNVLQNILQAKKAELEKMVTSDRFAVSDELQTEVKIYYLEHQRLLKQARAVREGEKIVSTELNRVRNEINDRDNHNMAIGSLQQDLASIVDKLVSYRKSEVKLQNEEVAFNFLQEDPETATDKFQQEIEDIQKESEAAQEEINQIEENEDEMVENLQKVIFDQSDKINVIIQQLNGIEPEEEEEHAEEETKNENDNEKKQTEEEEHHEENKQDETKAEEVEETKEVNSTELKEPVKKLILGERGDNRGTFMTNDGTPMKTLA